MMMFGNMKNVKTVATLLAICACVTHAWIGSRDFELAQPWIENNLLRLYPREDGKITFDALVNKKASEHPRLFEGRNLKEVKNYKETVYDPVVNMWFACPKNQRIVRYTEFRVALARRHLRDWANKELPEVDAFAERLTHRLEFERQKMGYKQTQMSLASKYNLVRLDMWENHRKNVNDKRGKELTDQEWEERKQKIKQDVETGEKFYVGKRNSPEDPRWLKHERSMLKMVYLPQDLAKVQPRNNGRRLVAMEKILQEA